MRINTNITALNTLRQNHFANDRVQKTMEKLSTGLRINKASDDAAGLSISEKLRSRIRGLDQAQRNIQDGISLTQVADGASNEIHSILQRSRELSVQAANDTLSSNDKQNIQDEITQNLAEIDRICKTTKFNGISVINTSSNDADIITGLKSSWLKQGEQLVSTYYGLTGDGANMDIVLDQTPQPYLAAVSYNLDGAGKAINLQLHVDAADFSPATLPNGGNAPMYDDRIITHELAHAIMGRNMNFGALSTWFKEGTAEFIHGADERLAGDIAANGGGGAGRAAVVAAINGAWASDSLHYSAGYAATRYLHDQIKTNFGGTGIKDIMTYLKNNAGSTLDQALNSVSGGTYATEAAFIADFNTNGAAFINSMNLANADTGAIGGFDADGGAARDAASVVPDTINYTNDPLTGFNEIWPTNIGAPVNLQVDADQTSQIQVDLARLDTTTLGLAGVDVVNNATTAISSFDSAIDYVSAKRSAFGAISNRLEHALAIAQNTEENTTASESRIRDVDMAKESMNFAKENILAQASLAMMSQANQQPQSVLSLLR